MARRLVWWILGLVGAAVVLGACHGGPHVALTVDDTGDAGDADPGDGVCATATATCTLRAAVDEANAQPADTITDIGLPAGTYPVASTLLISGKTTITGTGTATIDGNDSVRVLRVQASGWLGLNDVSVTGGSASEGGGLFVDGTTILDGVTLHDNAATVRGGAASVSSTGTLAAQNTTVSDNEAPTGGGLYTKGSIDLRHVTVTANVGDGIATGFVGTTELEASIVADQTSGADCLTSAPVSHGSNLDSDGTCLPAPAPGDQPAGEAHLAPLQLNGGLTPTHLPAPSSDARDAIASGTAPCDGKVADDQRDVARPQQGSCDAGAVEVLPGEATGTDCGPPPTLVPGADLRGCDLTLTDLSGADLTGADLAGATLLGANLTGTNLTDADLTGALHFGSTIGRASATYTGARLPGADLTYLNLGGKDLTGADLTGADLTGALLDAATLTGADLEGAGLRGADLLSTNLDSADLGGADLEGARLDGATLVGADLRYASGPSSSFDQTDFTGADLSQANLYDADVSTALGLNTTIGRCTVTWTAATAIGLDLSGCDLAGSDLDMSLQQGDLSGADLSGADLSGTYTNTLFVGTDITGADITGAWLQFVDLSSVVGLNTTSGRCSAVFWAGSAPGVDLSGCSLEGHYSQVDFTGANLSAADATYENFFGADLTGAILTAAQIDGMWIDEGNLTGADLTGAIGTPNDGDSTVYANTICADGTNSDSNAPTFDCDGHWIVP